MTKPLTRDGRLEGVVRRSLTELAQARAQVASARAEAASLSAGAAPSMATPFRGLHRTDTIAMLAATPQAFAGELLSKLKVTAAKQVADAKSDVANVVNKARNRLSNDNGAWRWGGKNGPRCPPNAYCAR